MKPNRAKAVIHLNDDARRKLRSGLALDVARRVLADLGLDIDKCLPPARVGGRLRQHKEARG